MKLQINQRGAWRDIVEFAPEQLEAIKLAAAPLARALGAAATWRISKDSRTGLAYLDAPAFKWRK